MALTDASYEGGGAACIVEDDRAGFDLVGFDGLDIVSVSSLYMCIFMQFFNIED